MVHHCPLINDDCKANECMFFDTMGGDCLISEACMSFDTAMGNARKEVRNIITRMRAKETRWPRWEDGSYVNVGQIAMSFRGPIRITEIASDNHGFTLWGRRGDDERYIIDQGCYEYDNHPVRFGEPCDFWPEDINEEIADEEGNKIVRI